MYMLSRFNKTKKLRDYLEEEKYSYPQIFENSPDILLFVIDLKGVIVNIVGELTNYLELESEQVIGKKYKNFIYEEDLKNGKRLFHQGIKRRSPICQI